MLKNRKGFTLVELIIVVAILGILAAIAVPNLSGIRYRQQVNADASTANNLIRACRLQHTDKGDEVTTLVNGTGTGELMSSYFDTSTTIPQSVPGATDVSAFVLDYDDTTDKYSISWTPDLPGFSETQTVTEGVVFEITENP